MRRRLRWGIIGTGGIAADFATAVATSSDCGIVNVAGSSPAKAKQFAERFELPSYSSSPASMVNEAGVEAVYIASPNSLHEEHTLLALRAGKHVLCEKPLATNAESAERMIAVARETGCYLMEAFMYRCHPLIPTLIETLSAGSVGAIRHLRADFGFRCERDVKHRLFRQDLGGGAILDVGGYPVSFARLIAGISAGKPFAEPTRIVANGQLGPSGVDERASCLLQFQSGFTAELACSVRYNLGTRVEIFGDLGSVVLPNLWLCDGQRQGLENRFIIQRGEGKPETVKVVAERAVYALEAESVLSSLAHKQPRWPLMSLDDSLGNLRVLDAWRAQAYQS